MNPYETRQANLERHGATRLMAVEPNTMTIPSVLVGRRLSPK